MAPRRSLFLAVFATLATMLVAAPASVYALAHATPTKEPRYLRATGTVLATSDTGDASCRGAVVAPGWVLTARHCLTGTIIAAGFSPAATITGYALDPQRIHFAPDGSDIALAFAPGLDRTANLLMPAGAEYDLCAQPRTGRIVSGGHDDQERPDWGTHMATVAVLGACDDAGARFSATGPAACQGDSGAPLIVETPAGQRIAGVVTQRIGGGDVCGRTEGAIGIAAPLAPHLNWINALIAAVPTAPARVRVLTPRRVRATGIPSWTPVAVVNMNVRQGRAYKGMTDSKGVVTLPAPLPAGTWRLMTSDGWASAPFRTRGSAFALRQVRRIADRMVITIDGPRRGRMRLSIRTRDGRVLAHLRLGAGKHVVTVPPTGIVRLGIGHSRVGLVGTRDRQRFLTDALDEDWMSVLDRDQIMSTATREPAPIS